MVEADAKAGSNMRSRGESCTSIPSGWFVTASDQYDRNGALWKTLVNFVTYDDRAGSGRPRRDLSLPALFPDWNGRYRSAERLYVRLASMPGSGCDRSGLLVHKHGRGGQRILHTGKPGGCQQPSLAGRRSHRKQ